MPKSYDIVLIHPPSMTHYWKKPILPGPIHRTVSIYTPLFIMFPIGMISIASYLEERGIRVKIFNLAEMLLKKKDFDFRSFIKSLNSEIYGIGLHWAVHTHGAIEIAKLCKELHPDSIVLMGGLTATCFAEEIVRDFDFVDCVIRGEGEYPLYRLFDNLKKFNRQEAFLNTPSLTYKSLENVVSTPPEHIFNDLDEFNFTRLDLVEPYERTITSPTNGVKIWNLPFYRGCGFNCATCCGSKTSYRDLLNRTKLAIRSPEKLLEDFIDLDLMGINSVFLFMDPRLCGPSYLERFFKLFRNSRWSNIKNVGVECFFPASESYFEQWKQCRIAENLGFSISPESASDKIRIKHGRYYTTEQLLRSVTAANRTDLPIGVFFLLVLGHENIDSLNEMLSLWRKLLNLNKSQENIRVDFSPMIFLDPCSPAFFNPLEYGYKIRFKRLTDYYSAIEDFPHWSMWLNYETQNFNRIQIVKIILEMWEKLTKLRYQFGFISDETYDVEMLLVEFEKSVFSNLIRIDYINSNELTRFSQKILEISKDMGLTKKYILENKVNESILSYPYE
jgi:B12-binding domain/radical SAM domain protein